MTIANISDLWISLQDRERAHLAEMLRVIHEQEQREREDRARYLSEEQPCRPSWSFFDDDSGQPTSGPL